MMIMICSRTSTQIFILQKQKNDTQLTRLLIEIGYLVSIFALDKNKQMFFKVTSLFPQKHKEEHHNGKLVIFRTISGYQINRKLRQLESYIH